MSIHEECGVFGVFSPYTLDISSVVYYGLYALQHRGQESCGIVVNDDGVFTSHKDLGLVGEVFSRNILTSLPSGQMAVGHVRYGTTEEQTEITASPSRLIIKRAKWRLPITGI